MIYATNGSTIYIGEPVSLNGNKLTEAEFTGQSWTEIKCLENLGTVGDTANEITFDGINCGGDSGRTMRFKGTRNAGTMELIFGLDYSNAGQAALLAAEANDNENFAFRIVLNDAPEGGTPSERLFAAVVGGAQEAYDSANSVVKLQASLWVNSNIVRINAST